MKSILSMLICISFFSGAAQAALSTQQMSQHLDEILAGNSAVVTEEQRAQLMDQFSTLSQMTRKQLVSVNRTTSIQQFASCRLADGAIIVNAVGEAMPVGTMGVREINARYMGKPVYLGGTKGALDTAQEIFSDRISWSSFFGGGLESIPGVIVETLSSFDQAKVEAEIHKAFPGTQMLALKMKGEASYCGQATLKLDILEVLLKN